MPWRSFFRHFHRQFACFEKSDLEKKCTSLTCFLFILHVRCIKPVWLFSKKAEFRCLIDFLEFFWHQPESGRVRNKSPTTLSYLDFLAYPFWKVNHFEPYPFHPISHRLELNHKEKKKTSSKRLTYSEKHESIQSIKAALDAKAKGRICCCFGPFFLDLKFRSNLRLLHFSLSKKGKIKNHGSNKSKDNHHAQRKTTKRKKKQPSLHLRFHVNVSNHVYWMFFANNCPRLETKISVHFPKLLPISTTSSLSWTKWRAKCLQGAATWTNVYKYVCVCGCVSKPGIFLKWYKKWPVCMKPIVEFSWFGMPMGFIPK